MKTKEDKYSKSKDKREQEEKKKNDAKNKQAHSILNLFKEKVDESKRAKGII